MTTATPVAIQRRCTMVRPQSSQNRLAVFSWRMCGQSTRGPMVLRKAGSSVVATPTETSGMSMPPTPIERRNGTGMTTSATRPMATVSPLNTTARPAVTMAFSTAWWLVIPLVRSSRQRVTMSSE